MKNLYILVTALFLSASLSAQNVGVDQSSPASKLDVNGNLTVGSGYSGTSAAPANGAIFEGNVGIGTSSPNRLLQVAGPEGNFFVHPNFGPGNNTVLTASFQGLTGGPQLRFEGPSAGFIDIGNDSANNFVVEANDNIHFIVGQDGHVGVASSNPANLFQIDGQTGGFDDAGIRLENATASTGWSLYPSSSGVMFIGKTTNLGTFDGTSGAYTATSDARLKRNIQPLESVLPALIGLEMKRYEFINNNPDNRQFIGVLAQDLQEIYPELVSVNTANDGNAAVENQLGVDYGGMSVLAIKAIQEQQEIIEAQQAVIEDLVKRIEALEEK